MTIQEAKMIILAIEDENFNDPSVGIFKDYELSEAIRIILDAAEKYAALEWWTKTYGLCAFDSSMNPVNMDIMLSAYRMKGENK